MSTEDSSIKDIFDALLINGGPITISVGDEKGRNQLYQQLYRARERYNKTMPEDMRVKEKISLGQLEDGNVSARLTNPAAKIWKVIKTDTGDAE